MDAERTAELLVELFRGRPGVIGVEEPGKNWRPVQLPGELQPAWVCDTHLAGEKAIGIYPLLEDGAVWWAAADIDDHDNNRNHDWFDQSITLCQTASRYQLHPLLAISRSGRGAHVLFFFDEPVEATLARSMVLSLGEDCGLKLAEVYPKQTSLEGKSLGNLLRLPLWGQSRLLDWETGAEVDATEALEECLRKRATADDAAAVVRWIVGSLPEREPTVDAECDGALAEVSPRVRQLLAINGSTLAKRWAGVAEGTDGTNSAMMQGIANELVRAYVPTDEIRTALAVWCEGRGYLEKGMRIMPRTIDKAYEWVSGAGPQASKKAIDFVGAVELFLHERRSGRHTVIPFGIPELDHSVDGIGPGQLCIVAGRPSHGKSLLGLQWADQAARLGHRALFISEEMSAGEIGQRVALWGTLENDDDRILTAARKRYAGVNRPQLVTHLGDMDAVERCIEYHHTQFGVDCIVVDYLQLLGGANGRYEIVSDISRRLKRITGRLGLHTMVLCQTNRQIEARDCKIPQNSDLRESGQIEQDADLIIFGVWPARFDGSTADPNEYWFFCTKRRNGPIRTPAVQSAIQPERCLLGGFTS